MYGTRSLLIFVLLTISSFGRGQDISGVRKVNGTRLFVSVAGSGEPIVVLHGGPGLNHAYFKPHLRDLEKNFKVIYYDQRACGQSATPPADSISMDFLIADLEGIRKEFKIEKLNLLAHSWGVVLATHYALKYPHRIRKIIFSNPAFLSREYDKEAGELAKKKVTREDSTKLATLRSAGMNWSSSQIDQLFKITFRSSAYNRANVDKLNLNLPENFVKANQNLLGGLMKDPSLQTNLYDSLAQFKFPVLIIHGEADNLPMSSINRLKTSLPDGELIVLNRSGHFPFVEEPENYRTVVLRFFK